MIDKALPTDEEMHDRQPFRRLPTSQDDIRWHFEDDIAEEEDRQSPEHRQRKT